MKKLLVVLAVAGLSLTVFARGWHGGCHRSWGYRPSHYGYYGHCHGGWGRSAWPVAAGVAAGLVGGAIVNNLMAPRTTVVTSPVVTTPVVTTPVVTTPVYTPPVVQTGWYQPPAVVTAPSVIQTSPQATTRAVSTYETRVYERTYVPSAGYQTSTIINGQPVEAWQPCY